MPPNIVAYLFVFPLSGFMCHLYTAIKYAVRMPEEVLGGENHVCCHRIVHKICKKSERESVKKESIMFHL